MENLTDNQILDYKKWYLPKGDPGFNPQKNKEVIEQTIRKTDYERKKRDQEYREAVRERAEAATDYLFSRHGAGARRSIEKYFGRATLAKLRAEDIKNKLKGPSLLNK